MIASQYDVVIVGAGSAGLTAAIGLARNGFTVSVLETAQEPGGIGMLGGVCFAESLIQPDVLGVDGMEALGGERRLIERGFFVTDGRRIAGNIYRDADAFRSCYTVLRARFNQHLAGTGRTLGVTMQTETTVESLIRDGRRIIGVATTRGPVYAKLVFLAEGDAGLLVSREGFDRFHDPQVHPSFLYCLQQIIELPAGAIEDGFRLGPDEGVAYDLLLRNLPRSPLNARGYLCTNRQSLTLSLVVPAKNLHKWFTGEPRQLLDSFVSMPALRPWLRLGQLGAWTAGLLRTGGFRDMPYFIEDGLVIGGAAAGLGLDFPLLNTTGPATATGVLLSRAATQIRAEGRAFDRDALVQHYLTPLQQTRYWRDLEFIQRWPDYLPRAHFLFESTVDLLLDSASIWAQARRGLVWKITTWLGVLSRISWRGWSKLRDELIVLSRVLRSREMRAQTPVMRLLLEGALNAFRDLLRKPRPHLPPHGTLRLYFHSADHEGRASAVPWLVRRWFERFRPVLAAAEHTLSVNSVKPLSAKLTSTLDLLLRQINLFDFLAVAALLVPLLWMSMSLAIGRRVFRWKRRLPAEVRSVGWMEVSMAPHDAPGVVDRSAHASIPLISIVWQSTQSEKQAASVGKLPHICPTQVFKIHGTPPETIRVLVDAQRCIHCQACWRLNPVVDWGRDGIAAAPTTDAVDVPQAGGRNAFLSEETRRREAASLLDQLEHQLQRFDLALAEGPAVVDRPHNDYLEMLGRYGQQLAKLVRELLRAEQGEAREGQQRTLEVINALVAHTEERTHRIWQGRFTWAAADGRLIRQHHLALLRRMLALPATTEQQRTRLSESWTEWIALVPEPPADDAVFMHLLANIAARRYLLEILEQPTIANGETFQTQLLAGLAAEVRDNLAKGMMELKSLRENHLNPPSRKAILSPPKAFAPQASHLLKDTEEARKLLDVPGAWQKMAQLTVLIAEREELAEFERRLLALGASWKSSPIREIDEAVNADFGRQAAHLLAGKRLLLKTFTLLEKADDGELAILLLRVWLDYTATLLDELTILVRDGLQPARPFGERPLVELDSGAPLRTQVEYLAAPTTYSSGDFLLAPLDLLQPRLVPEMVSEKEIAIGGPAAAALLRALKSLKGRKNVPLFSPGAVYLAEAMTVELMGRLAADPEAALDLEWSCTRVILAHLEQSEGALRERCMILQALVNVIMPRWLHGSLDTRARHLHRDALQLETLKADFRRRLTAAWQVFGEALGRNAAVQGSCFALAEAAAWLQAADSVLGRMAWVSRLSQAEEREEPSLQQDVGRGILAHCFAEIRDRLFRFDEDLAALRRGYYAPHIYAANRLLFKCNFPSPKR